MPVTLGQLPINQPVPTGLVQLKRGVSPGTINMNNTISPRALQDGAGGAMQIGITPSQAGWWLIRAEMIWSVPDATWTYWHWGVVLSPADANGTSEDRNHCSQHSLLGWCESVLNTAYRLNAGVAYTCSMWWPNATAGFNQGYYTGGEYHCIMGEFVGEGSI